MPKIEMAVVDNGQDWSPMDDEYPRVTPELMYRAVSGVKPAMLNLLTSPESMPSPTWHYQTFEH